MYKQQQKTEYRLQDQPQQIVPGLNETTTSLELFLIVFFLWK